jgi:Flp pilus assembly protein TadG
LAELTWRQATDMKTRSNRPAKLRRGAVLVEFAITLPILLAFFGFFWEFARAEQIRQTTATAAYEGARQGIVKGGSANDATQAAQAILDAVSIRDATVVVTPSTISSETTSVQVSISVPVASNAWVMPFFIDNLDITANMTLNRN